MNGTLRQFGYEPMVGERLAHQISCFTAIGGFALLVFAVTRRWRIVSVAQGWIIGLAWAGLTVAFETALGLGGGLTLPEVFADYAIWDGRLWPLVIAFVLVAPVLAALRRQGPVARVRSADALV